jgi:LPXTG-motif cell wall-anchored protein
MDPYFPYELSKYLILFYLVSFAFLSTNKKFNKSALVLFIITSIYSVVSIMKRASPALVNSYSNGILIVLLGYAILKQNKALSIGTKDLLGLCKKWLDYLVVCSVFLIVKTPNIDDMRFTLGANYASTGGESSNQVSTYLGFALFLLVYILVLKRNYSGFKILDYVLLFILIIQTLLTFSRGGFLVFIATTMYLAYLLDYVKLNLNKLFLIGAIIFLVLGGFYLLNFKTQGVLLNRYKGETNATILGLKEKNLNVVSSNRLVIIQDNLIVFKENIFGVGPSFATQKRMEISGDEIYDHTEPSRWLVEYGIFGIVIFIWFSSILLEQFKVFLPENVLRPYSVFLITMVLFSLLTMLHSATRTFVSFLPMLLGFIKLNPNVTTANRRYKSPQKA